MKFCKCRKPQLQLVFEVLKAFSLPSEVLRMCRFTGSKHRDYSPSRSATLNYWRRLPTIYEATDIEMAEEKGAIDAGEDQERSDMETEQPLVEKVSSTPLQKSQRSKTERVRNMRCKSSVGEPGLIVRGESQFLNVQDEWSYLLRTPYADFFPANVNASILDGCFSLPSTKKKQVKSINAELQAHQFSEIAAWLEFFG